MIARDIARGAGLGIALGCAMVLTAGPGPARAASDTVGVAAQTPATEAAPDFSGLQRLLDEFLVAISPPGAPLETAFQYDQLFVQLDRRERLGSIRRQLLAVPPSRMDDATRKAWAINTYNFVVIETVTEHLYVGARPINGEAARIFVRRKNASVQEIRMPEGRFFDAALLEIEGVKYSLNRFERHFLFGDFDAASKDPPPSRLDPRFHFALVSAARSSPPLLPRAYRPDSLEAQLDSAVRNFLASPRNLRWDEERGVLMGTSLFSWYAADFGGSAGVISFVRRCAPPSILELIESRKIPWVSAFFPWDWSLNQPPQGSQRAPGRSG